MKFVTEELKVSFQLWSFKEVYCALRLGLSSWEHGPIIPVCFLLAGFEHFWLLSAILRFVHEFQGLIPDVWLPLRTEERRWCSRKHSPRLEDLENTVHVLEGKDFLVCAHQGLQECLQHSLIEEPSSTHRRKTRLGSVGLTWGHLSSTWKIMFG